LFFRLEEESTCSILEHTAADGKTYATQFYTLDAIMAVGYRVNSKRATQFRVWAIADACAHDRDERNLPTDWTRIRRQV